MKDIFKNLFGKKSWYQSLTAWGLVILGISNAAVAQACAPGIQLVDADTCSIIVKGLNMVGTAFTVLGLRKAAQETNVA